MTAGAESINSANTTPTSNASSRKLYWFKSKVNGQFMDCVLDSAATVTCIAKRCITSNPYLAKLKRHPYPEAVFDANKNMLNIQNFVQVTICVGSPAVSRNIKLVIVDGLPYSCLVGTDYLSTFNSWGIDNLSSTLILDTSRIQVFDRPQHNQNVNLITSSKTTLLPGESKLIRTTAVGPGVTANRPITDQVFMCEGLEERENRCNVRVFPSLNTLGLNNDNTVFLQAINTSNQTRSVGKQVKIGQANCNFERLDAEAEGQYVNVVNVDSVDVIDIMMNRKDVSHLSDTQYAKAREVLSEFRDLFSVSNERIGSATECSFHVDPSLPPVSVPLRRVPMHKEHIVRELLNAYKHLGLIEQIDSPFRAATVLVEKKNPKSSNILDRYRICVDYRVLNKLLPDSGWPAPAIDHCLDAAADAKYLSTLDFNNGYYQIPCTESAKYSLAFSPGVGFGQYTFTGMPPGVKPAASYFQQSMEKTFRGLEKSILPPYFDDITVKGSTFNEHLENIRLSLARVRKSGFTLNAFKCKFFRIRMGYLGHIIENGTVSLDPERVSAVLKIEPPTNVKSLRSFIGMIQFCSRFIPNLNERIAPLYNLLKKGTRYVWTGECQTAFIYIKSILTSPPVLRCPMSMDQFILETDASDVGIGACLKVNSNGKEYIVGYHSGKFHDSQCKWHIVEKEAHAIIASIEKFKHYLLGKRFILRTDSRILSYLNTSKSKKLANWALQLSNYAFDVVHIPSKHNAISDFFSRSHEVNVISQLKSTKSSGDWRLAQNSCNYIKSACEYVRKKKNFDVKLLGPLKRFRKFLELDDDGVLRWRKKIVVPENFRADILEMAHDHMTSGHFREERTWRNISNHYFWPNLRDDIVNWIRSCKACNDFDIQQYVNRPLNPIEVNNRFELVCYDLAGPFIPSRHEGNTYALIMVDHFTKWCEIVALKRANSPNIARSIFDQWCCRYGIMNQLHSDGAQNVHGEIIKELCKLIGTVKSKSSRLHPQGDGMSEAIVKIAKNAVKKQVDMHGLDWDLYLQPTAFAIRGAMNNSTKFAPAELMFGENLTRPIDMLDDDVHENRPFFSKQANAFATTLRKRLDKSMEVVNRNLDNARKKMKNVYDRKISHHRFNEGEFVMLWWPYTTKGKSRVFQPKWKGPYKIVRLIDETNCTIILENGTLKNVHLNQVKPVQVRNNLRNDRDVQGNVQSSAEDVGPLFDDLSNDNVEIDDHIQNEDVENDQWCGLDIRNVLNSRTRSGNV